MAAHNPYVGARAIAEGMRLHGRDAETRDLARLLLTERIVLLYSPTGAGKTSLIQAGLIPLLRRQPGLCVYLIRGLRPAETDAGLGIGNRYLASLVGQLDATLPEERRRCFDWHAPGASLRNYLDRWRAEGEASSHCEGLVLLLDRFEDLLFQPDDHPDKEAFFRELGQSLSDRRLHGLHALFIMGERHIAELDEYLHLVPTGLARRYRLGPLDRDQARQAIIGPAQEQQVQYDPLAVEALLQRLTERSGPRSAPSKWIEPLQLQIVCERLWEDRFASPSTPASVITVADVEAFSVESALEDYYADTAQSAANAAGIPERDVREWIEDRLILPSGARGQALRADTLEPTLPELATEVLEQAHLVRLQILGDSRWYELVHNRLVDPIRRSNRRWFEHNLAPVQRVAHEWCRAKTPDRLLLSTGEWLKAWRWRRDHQNELRPEESEFWRRSTRRLLQSRVFPAVAVLVIAAAGAAGYWSWRENEAEKAARQLQQMLVRLGHAKEMALERSLDSALIDGARTAGRVQKLPRGEIRDRLKFSARDTLMTVLRSSRNVRALVAHDDARMNTVAIRPGSDDATFAYGGTGTGGQVMLVTYRDDGVFQEATHAACDGGRAIKALAFNPQGTLLALGCADGRVSVWSTDDWTMRAGWRAHKERTLTVAFDRHGTTVASGGHDDNAVRVMPLSAVGAAMLDVPRELKAEQIPVLPPGQRLVQKRNIRGGVWALAFSPREDILIAGDGKAGLWLCSLGPAAACRNVRPSGERDAIIELAVSPDGGCIAAGTFQGGVSLWDEKLSSSQDLGSQAALAHGLAFATDGDITWLWVGRSTHLSRIQLRNCRPVGEKFALEEAEGSLLVGDEVTDVAFHTGRRVLAVTTAVGYLALISEVDEPNERVERVVRIVDGARPAEQDPGWRGALAADDGWVSRLVVGRELEDKLFIVRVEHGGAPRVDGSVVAGQRGVKRVTASVAGRIVATLGQDGSIRFWQLIRESELVPHPVAKDVQNPWRLASDAAFSRNLPPPFEGADTKEVSPLVTNFPPDRILLSPDGSLLACLFKVTHGVLLVDLNDPASSWWEPTSGEKGAGATPPLELAFDQDGTVLAAGSDRIWLWEVNNHSLKARATNEMRLSGLASTVAELAFATTPRGRSVVIAGGANGQIFVWDARNGNLKRKLRAGSQQVEQMAFLPAKDLLAAADKLGRVTLWDTGEWQSMAMTSRSESTEPTRFLSFALGGDALVSGADNLRVWDINVRSLRDKTCDVLAFQPGVTVSRRVNDACASNDGN